MARKRLSDLLREEVKKPSEAASTEEPAAKEHPPDAPSSSPAAEIALPAPDPPATPDLELQQHVADLQAELKQQTSSAKKLQTNLEKLEKRNQQLETELAEAKQTVLQLADNNAQLKQELEALQRSQRPPQPTQPVATKPVVAAKPVPAPAPKSSGAHPLTQQEVLRRRQADSLAHPMFPAGNTPGHLSEQDLGWVD